MQVKTFVCNMLHENSYVVYDETTREAAVIDPGMYTSREQQLLTDFVRSSGLHVKYLLCTHLHFDHIFGVPYVEDTFGVKLCASLADEMWVTTFSKHITRFGIPYDEVPRPVTYPLCDGDELLLGDTVIRCIATPGHSAGGMCFYVESGGLLFVGDTLFQGSIGRTDFSDGNYAQLICSIQERLFVLPPFTTVYCGHGASTTIADEMSNNPYL